VIKYEVRAILSLITYKTCGDCCEAETVEITWLRVFPVW